MSKNSNSTRQNPSKNLYIRINRGLTKRIKRIKNERYEKRIRKSLHNSDFSIISSTCVGGIIYHRLNQKFLSPTIDLWFYQKDFVKFVVNLSEYLNYDLKFVEGIRDYPVAYLNDIKIFFMHYDNEDSARKAWERRKTRINFNNLYIIMVDADTITDDDIKKLKSVPCRNVIVLSNKKRAKSIDCFKYIKTKGKFTDKDKYGMRVFEKHWDFVKWLNQEKE